MEHITTQLNSWGIVALLVFTRLWGIAIVLPSLGGRTVGMALRLVLCLCLTALVAPVCSDWVPTHVTQELPTSRMCLLFGQELVVGLLLGMGLQMLLLGVQVAGQLVSQMAGVSLAAIYDASTGRRSAPVTKLLDLLALCVFLLLGGHRLVIGAVLNAFQDWPPGTVEIGSTAATAASELLTRSFLLGIQAALPVLATLLASNILAGMLGRLMPQMNVLLVSSGLNSLLLMASLLVGLGAMTWTLQDHLEPLVGTVVRLCSGS